MPNRVTLKQVARQVVHLSPQEQLKLVAYICEQLSAKPFTAPRVKDGAELRRQRAKAANDLLRLCDAAAEKWEGEFDSAEEIRRMRQERAEQICPSRS